MLLIKFQTQETLPNDLVGRAGRNIDTTLTALLRWMSHDQDRDSNGWSSRNKHLTSSAIYCTLTAELTALVEDFMRTRHLWPLCLVSRYQPDRSTKCPAFRAGSRLVVTTASSWMAGCTPFLPNFSMRSELLPVACPSSLSRRAMQYCTKRVQNQRRRSSLHR